MLLSIAPVARCVIRRIAPRHMAPRHIASCHIAPREIAPRGKSVSVMSSVLSSMALVLGFVLVASTPSSAHAQDPAQGVRIGLNYQLGTKPGILVLPTETDGSADSIRAIIQRDIDYDDRASVVFLSASEAAPYIPAPGKKVNFALLAKLGVAAVIYPRPTLAGLTIDIYDVGQQKSARTSTFALPTTPNTPAWRMALHGVSDQIGNWIFGSRGSAQSRISFVQNGQIWMIDSDGANPRKLTEGKEITMSPSWHPDGSRIAYAAQSNRGWQIHLYSFATGESRAKSSSTRGLNFTPVFSPDGKKLVYSNSALEGGTNIVLSNAEDNAPASRLTVGKGTDNTSPSFSPNGQRIAFMSGRSGHPEIYTMDSDGTNVQLLTEYTFGERAWRASPDWAPDGRMIAYQSRIGRDFQIMTIDMRDGATKQYTHEGENEDPSWASDGRHLVFSSTRSGVRQLWVLDVESGRLRQLTRQSGAKLPAWSLILKR